MLETRDIVLQFEILPIIFHELLTHSLQTIGVRLPSMLENLPGRGHAHETPPFGQQVVFHDLLEPRQQILVGCDKNVQKYLDVLDISGIDVCRFSSTFWNGIAAVEIGCCIDGQLILYI